jgi:hypothetical protein
VSRNPFDADRFADGFTEEEVSHEVDPASPLGKEMAEARDAEPLDPDFRFEPIPVED